MVGEVLKEKEWISDYYGILKITNIVRIFPNETVSKQVLYGGDLSKLPRGIRNFPYSCYHKLFTVSSNLDLLLHKDFPHFPSSSNSVTRPSSTTERNKSTEHCAIQKGSVHCTQWLQLKLLACYLPSNIVMSLSLTYHRLPTSVFLVKPFTGTLGLLHSSLNPILYCWKIGEYNQIRRQSDKCSAVYRVSSCRLFISVLHREQIII